MIIPASQLWDHFVGGLNGVLLDRSIRTLLKDNPILIVDFNHVPLMDAGCANTAFAALAQERSEHAFEGGALVVANLNDSVCFNLETALIARACTQSLRHCVVVMRDYAGDDHLLGKCEAHVSETFALLQQCRTLRNGDLQGRFDLTPSAASTRLKWLYTLGLCVRQAEITETGRTFVYETIGAGV